MSNYLKKNDSFYVAGHNGMVGQAIVKALIKKGYCDENNGGKLYVKSKEELDYFSKLFN